MDNKGKKIIKTVLKYRIPLCMLLFLLAFNLFQIRFRENVFYVDNLKSDIASEEELIAQDVDTFGLTVTEDDGKGKLVYSSATYYSAGEYDFVFEGASDCDENTVMIYSKSTGETYLEESYVPGKKYHLTLPVDDEKLRFGIFYAGKGTCSIKKAVVSKNLSAKETGCLMIFHVCWLILLGIAFFLDRKEIKSRVFQMLSFFFVTVVVVGIQTLILNALAVGDLQGNYLDMLNHWLGGEVYLKLFLLNFIVFLAIHLMVYGVIRRPGISMLVSSVLLWLMAEVMLNYYLIRGEAFNLTQLQLAGEAAQVVSGFTITFPWNLIGWVALISVVASLCLSWEHFGLPNLCGVIPVVLGLAIILGLYDKSYDILVPMDKYSVYILDWYYEDVGAALGVIRSAPCSVEEPEDYDKKTIAAISEDVEVSTDIASTPDIIFIQCESLFDLSLITESYWSEDPLAELYALDEKENAQVMYMLSPMTGGGTCNVEYEALTGYPVYNTDGTPYIDKISVGMPSMVSVLEELGYCSTAIHTNTGGYFNRRSVYTSLGFDHIIFSEEFQDDATVSEEDIINGWYDDWAAYKLLIEDYENRDETKPYFAHVVTTQNHGPYVSEYYDGIDVDADLSVEANSMLQNYLNLSKLSVDSLQKLIDYFSSAENDVVLVFWGDHCPGYSMFNISLQDSTSEIKSHYTPMVVWNNYDLETQWPQVVSTYQMPIYLCHDLDINNDVYMNYLYENNVPSVLGSIVVEGADTFSDISAWDESQNALWHNLWLLQYDRMFGKKYSVAK